VAATPNSASTALPPQSTASVSQPPTKGHTPAPDQALSRQAAEPKPSLPIHPESSGPAPTSPALETRVNGGSAVEKVDKEKFKKKEKRDRKDKEKRDGGASTPEVPATSTPPPSEPSAAPAEPGKQEMEELKSPTESTGVRTPKSNRPPRHPWTIFMRMSNQITVNENDIRDFFQDVKDGVSVSLLSPWLVPTFYVDNQNHHSYTVYRETKGGIRGIWGRRSNESWPGKTCRGYLCIVLLLSYKLTLGSSRNSRT